MKVLSTDGLSKLIELIKNTFIPSSNVEQTQEVEVVETQEMDIVETDEVTLATVATTGDYYDLENTPDIPTDTSDLTNNAGFITSSDLSSYSLTADTVSSVVAGTNANEIDITKDGTTSTITVNNVSHATSADSATSASNVAWSGVTDKPTALSSFTDDLGTSPTHTHSQYATTANTYTKAEIDGKLSAAMHFKGTVATVAALSNIIDPAIGDMYNITEDGTNYAWDGTVWDKLSETIDLSTLQPKIDTSHKVSADLIDDSTTTNKFVTASDKTAWSGKQDAISDLETIRTGAGKGATSLQPNDNISQLTNNAGYITASALPTVNNATLTIQKNSTDVATFTANASSNVTANIAVPTKVSELTNDTGFITSEALSGYTSTSTTVNGKALSSNITLTATDVSALPDSTVIPDAQVQSDWNQTTTTAKDYIKNKPSLATVATSGSYADLSNKPTIPTTTSSVTQNSTEALTSGGAYTALSSKQNTDTAVTHTKNTLAGSTTQPVYIATNGVATACTYELNKTVPSDAVFTDTNTLMTQNVSSIDADYPILLTPTANASTNQGEKTGIFASGVKVNPSTKTITATTFSGNATTATTATKLGTSNVGSASQGIYLLNGVATACTYKLWAGNKSAYDSITTKDNDTIYFILPNS